MTRDEYKNQCERVRTAGAIIERNTRLKNLLDQLITPEAPELSWVTDMCAAILEDSEPQYTVHAQRERLIQTLIECIQMEIQFNWLDMEAL